MRMQELDFRDLISGLVDWRLISYDKTKRTYTTHPLIKSYFESDFDEMNKKLCHKHIYQYFGLHAPVWPETLEEMQPLFEQVYHGCSAGLYDEVCYDVYWEKIKRKTEYFITDRLGAWETDLSLVRTFFPEGDFSQMPLVSEKSRQSLFLNEAGIALLYTGRPKESESLLVRRINLAIEDEIWEAASIGYQNLAELQFLTGEIERALPSAKKALDAAEKAEYDKYIVVSKAYLAWILHLQGKSEAAGNWFRQADELEGKGSGYRLWSLTGVWYADFLLSLKRIDEAFELTKQNLELCQSENLTNDISTCHRCHGAIERIMGNHKKAEVHLKKAIEIARKVDVPKLEIEVLLESGRLHLAMKKHEDAIRAAKEVLKICARTGFKLYAPETEVVLGKAYMALNDLEQAKNFARSAYEKAITMNYRWQEGDAAHLLGETYLKEGDKVEAREWLKKAVACRKEILDPEVEESETILKSL